MHNLNLIFFGRYLVLVLLLTSCESRLPYEKELPIKDEFVKITIEDKYQNSEGKELISGLCHFNENGLKKMSHNFQIYCNNKQRFKISVPEKWQINNKKNNFVKFQITDSKEDYFRILKYPQEKLKRSINEFVNYRFNLIYSDDSRNIIEFDVFTNTQKMFNYGYLEILEEINGESYIEFVGFGVDDEFVYEINIKRIKELNYPMELMFTVIASNIVSNGKKIFKK